MKWFLMILYHKADVILQVMNYGIYVHDHDEFEMENHM